MVAELKSFQRDFRKLNDRNVAAPEIELAEIVKVLADRYDPDSASATMSPAVFKSVLNDVPFGSDHGQWLRYGMFLATQLAEFFGKLGVIETLFVVSTAVEGKDDKGKRSFIAALQFFALALLFVPPLSLIFGTFRY